MKRLMRAAVSDLAYQARRLTGRAGGGLRVLMYHRVTDAHPGYRLCVPVKNFEAQMRWLREHGYQTMTFAQAVEWVQGGGTGNEIRGTKALNTAVSRFPFPVSRPVVLTFDDGFEDNFLQAYPAMARHGFTGCFFAPSAFIQAGVDGHPAADRPMSWAQLQELVRMGHEVGAHSVSHAELTTIPADAMRHEVRDCKGALEQGLGRPVEFFCYPRGDYDAAVRQAVVDAGYRGACSVEPGANGLGTDPYALHRTEISAVDTLWDFEKKLGGGFDWLHAKIQQVGA